MYDFSLLKPVSNIVDILGRVVIALSVIAGIYLISSSDYNAIAGIAIFLGGGILGLLMVLIAQLVSLFLQIEQNTRRQSE